MNKVQSIQALERFYAQYNLKDVISRFESQITSNKKNDITQLLKSGAIDVSLLDASMSIKDIVGQINVIIHAWGILVSLPHLLKDDEVIEYVSLGAGNGKKDFDLRTSHRIAEFKFISWKGGSETIRKNSLFKDFYNLAENEESLEKYLYVLGLDHPKKALQNNRSLKSTLAKRSLWDSFETKYQDKYKGRNAGDYFKDHEHLVKIVDLKKIVPEFFDN